MDAEGALARRYLPYKRPGDRPQNVLNALAWAFSEVSDASSTVMLC